MGNNRAYNVESKINTLNTEDKKQEFINEFLKSIIVPKNTDELKDLIRKIANELTDDEFTTPVDRTGNSNCILKDRYDDETLKTTGITVSFDIRTNDDYKKRYYNKFSAEITPDNIKVTASKEAFYIWFVNKGPDDYDKETDSEKFYEKTIEFTPDSEFLKDLFDNFDKEYKENRQKEVNIKNIKRHLAKTDDIAVYINLEDRLHKEMGIETTDSALLLTNALKNTHGDNKKDFRNLVLAFDNKGSGFTIYKPAADKTITDDKTEGTVYSLEEVAHISFLQFNEERVADLFRNLSTEYKISDERNEYRFIGNKAEDIYKNFDLYKKTEFIPDFKEVIDDIEDFYLPDICTDIPLEENEGMSFWSDALLKRAITGYDYYTGAKLFIEENRRDYDNDKELKDFILDRLKNSEDLIAFNAYHDENGNITIKAYTSEDSGVYVSSSPLKLTDTEEKMFKEAFDGLISDYEAMWEEHDKTDI